MIGKNSGSAAIRFEDPDLSDVDRRLEEKYPTVPPVGLEPTNNTPAGFPEDKARSALANNGLDVQRAINWLLLQNVDSKVPDGGEDDTSSDSDNEEAQLAAAIALSLQDGESDAE